MTPYFVTPYFVQPASKDWKGHKLASHALKEFTNGNFRW